MKHFVIPDTQTKAGSPTQHLTAAGNYIIDKKPPVLIHLGDHWDMPSIGKHNSRGHIIYEGARVTDDLQAGIVGMDALLLPIKMYNDRMRKQKKRPYRPRMVFCRGNHEDRLTRLFEQEPYLIGALPDFPISRFGWEDTPFLKPVPIDGVTYCHYAQGGAMGRAISRAHLISQKKHGSWVVGHQQILDIYFAPHLTTEGYRVQSIIAGSFYDHDEGFMGFQGNQHWRGCLMLNEVNNGQFDILTLSLNYLKEQWS